MRPVFKLNKNEIKAAGILFYRISKKKNNLQFLMIKDDNGYSDFGGKTDKQDKTFLETALRETFEETNNVINERFIGKKLDNVKPICNKKSKYALYLCELKKTPFRCADFGNFELHDNIKRSVKWISYNRLSKMGRLNKLNFRLRFRSFYEEIKKINRHIKPVM